jgi:phosphoribosylaminoimidazole (AIR) synthetase
VLERAEVTVHDAAPWDSSVRLGEALLAPTIVYANDILAAMAAVPVHGAVHITGGGFTENLPRVLPDGCACAIDVASWEVPPLFRWLQEAGARRCLHALLLRPAAVRALHARGRVCYALLRCVCQATGVCRGTVR